MKTVLTFSTLFLALAMFSCKKSDNPVVYPALQNTFWTGMFAYTSGDYTGLQPCTFQLLPDSTIKFTDAANQRDGGTWSTSGNKVTVVQPNKIVYSATFTADSWTSFINPSASGFQIDSLSKATPLQISSLSGTTWFGQVNGNTMKLKFTDASNVQITLTSTTFAGTYSIDGGGVRFGYPLGVGITGSGGFFAIANKDMTVLKGLEIFTSFSIFGGSKNYFYPFSVLKQ